MTTTPDRFWSKVEIGGPDECWPWRAYCDGFGHGRFTVSHGEPVPAHRFAWILTKGDPGAFCVLHQCDNPPCCNIAHLFLGTRGTNVRDAQRKGRPRSDSLSGLRGVTWDASRNQWMARCTIDGTTHHLGRFAEKSKAAESVAVFRERMLP